MKKILLIFGILVLCFAFAGCGSDSEDGGLSGDEKQLAEVRECIEKGDMEQAEYEAQKHRFDEDYYYYIA